MSDLENTIKRDLLLLERAVEGGHVEPYNVVDRCMSPFLRDVLYAAIYTHGANMDALTQDSWSDEEGEGI